MLSTCSKMPLISDAKKFKTGITVPFVTEKCVVANVLDSGRFYYYWHDYFAYTYIYISKTTR